MHNGGLGASGNSQSWTHSKCFAGIHYGAKTVFPFFFSSAECQFHCGKFFNFHRQFPCSLTFCDLQNRSLSPCLLSNRQHLILLSPLFYSATALDDILSQWHWTLYMLSKPCTRFEHFLHVENSLNPLKWLNAGHAHLTSWAWRVWQPLPTPLPVTGGLWCTCPSTPVACGCRSTASPGCPWSGRSSPLKSCHFQHKWPQSALSGWHKIQQAHLWHQTNRKMFSEQT